MAPKKPPIPSAAYDDGDGNVLVLRGSLTVGSRRDYAQTLAGAGAKPAASREDAWHRAVELLFERLAMRWEIAGMPIERQRELLARFRAADADEREFVLRSLRAHCAEWFPELEAP